MEIFLFNFIFCSSSLVHLSEVFKFFIMFVLFNKNILILMRLGGHRLP